VEDESLAEARRAAGPSARGVEDNVPVVEKDVTLVLSVDTCGVVRGRFLSRLSFRRF